MYNRLLVVVVCLKWPVERIRHSSDSTTDTHQTDDDDKQTEMEG